MLTIGDPHDSWYHSFDLLQSLIQLQDFTVIILIL